MLAVRNAFGVLLLALAIALLSRVLPASLILLLWGLLAAGVALFLGTLQLEVKTPLQKLAQLLGLLLLTYAVAAWCGALRGATDPLQPLGVASAQPAAAGKSVVWQPILTSAQFDQALAAAKQAQRPVVVDWYADWCISCKVMERELFENPQVQQQLAGYQLLRVDVTQNTADQQALLNRYQLFGPPAIQFFDAQGQEMTALRVVGEMGLEAFRARLNDVAAAMH